MKKIFENTMLDNFSYHDGKILEFYKDNNDFVLKFEDGWNIDQINEIRFVNALAKYKFDLKDRIIYQLGYFDYINSFNGETPFVFEIYVWYKENLTEVVRIQASNIITKMTEADGSISEEDLKKRFMSKVEY